MKRGSKGTPDSVKALRGNPGKRKVVEASAKAQETVAAPAAPVLAPPSFIAGDDVALEMWKRFAADYLPGLPYIKPSDSLVLARWCKAMSQWVAVSRELQHGMIVYETESKHGKMLRMHPLFQAQGRLEDRLIKIEDRLGLNPMARQALIRGVVTSGFLSPDAPQPKAAEDDPDLFEAAAEPAAPPSPVGLLAPQKPTTTKH